MTYVMLGLQLILSLSILVILHELGHFLPAKKFGMRVEKFYLFFDPWFSIFKKKKTVGIRVPDNNIARAIVRELGNPIVSTSIRDEDEVIEYTTDPELIFEKWENLVDVVVDGGYGGNVASTVIDLTQGEPILIREGKGDLEI
jgi:hypothetical protein